MALGHLYAFVLWVSYLMLAHPYFKSVLNRHSKFTHNEMVVGPVVVEEVYRVAGLD